MTLVPITLDATPDNTDISAVLVELQGLTVSVAAGTTSATNIPITGITTADTLVAVIRSNAGVLTSLTAEASITSNGNIQCSTTNSTSSSLLVVWFNKS